MSFGSQVAAAEPGKVPTRLDWGASVCGDAEGFSSRVLKRTQRVRFVESGERLTVRLSIAPQGDGLDARVVLQAPGRADVVRHIASPDCDDALDALALVVAISLEAQSQETRVAPRAAPRRPPSRARPKPAPLPEPPSPPEVSADPNPVAAPVAPEPPAAELPPEPPPEPEKPPAASVPEPATAERPELEIAPPTPAVSVELDKDPALDAGPSSPSDPERLGLAGGVSAQVLLGVVPEAMLGGQVWLRATWERESLWSPELTLGFAHQRRDGYVREDEGQADFELNAASLALCPLRLGSATLHVRPCAAGSTGRLKSSGHRTFFPGEYDRPWVTLGGEMQGVARLGVLELRASVGAFAPLIRDRFRFGPPCDDETPCEGVFHRVDASLWMAGVGAGVTFW